MSYKLQATNYDYYCQSFIMTYYLNYSQLKPNFMKILVAAFAYNEIKYLPEMIKYYNDQDCELLILDNYSTDGTFDYLKASGVITRRVNTNDTFHLGLLQAALVNDLSKIKPDWVVYTGIDVYYSFPGTIREEIEKAGSKGFNMISVQHFAMCNTGEKFRLPLQNNFFYARKGGRLRMIAKYSKHFHFEGDSILIPDPCIYDSPGVLINYGNCKPKEEREESYARRQKAWAMGLYRIYGIHYEHGHVRNWLWDKSELIDIRTTEYYQYMKKIII